MTVDLDRIKQEIDIAWLIGQTFTVIGNGRTLTTEEHDSLKIFTHNNSWTWYSQAGRDGKALGGSVIDWYMHIHRCGKGEAIRALNALQDGGTLPPAPKRIMQRTGLKKAELGPCLEKLIEIGAIDIEQSGNGSRYTNNGDRLPFKTW